MSEVCTAPAPDAQETQRPHAQETQRPALPPIVCKPWCEDGDGHVKAYAPEDQYCLAAVQGEFELSRETPEQLGEAYYRQTVSTFLECDPFGEPFVSLSVANAVGIQLTPSEAGMLRDDLSALLELLTVQS